MGVCRFVSLAPTAGLQRRGGQPRGPLPGANGSGEDGLRPGRPGLGGEDTCKHIFVLCRGLGRRQRRLIEDNSRIGGALPKNSTRRRPGSRLPEIDPVETDDVVVKRRKPVAMKTPLRHMLMSCAAALVIGVLAPEAQAAPPPENPAAAKPIENPYLAPTPELPKMTRTTERLPLAVMNRVLQPLPADAPPPSPDPRNLEGVWIHSEPHISRFSTTMTGRVVPFSAEGARVITERINADNAGHPIAQAAARCRPAGALKELDLNFPFRILQTPEEIDFIFEEFHSVWQIRMNQKHSIPTKREYGGDSIGWWDGDVLVVEATGFKDSLWLDTAGTPVGPDGKMIYRIRKIDGGKAMEVIVTIDDPQYYTEPWSLARRMVWRPDRFLGEYNCEEEIGADESASAQPAVKP